MRSSILLSLAAAALPAASAWWATGHMVTSQIAYNLLTPTTKGAVDALADSLADSYPASPDFVTVSEPVLLSACACAEKSWRRSWGRSWSRSWSRSLLRRWPSHMANQLISP